MEKSRGEVKSIPVLWGDSRSLRELGKSVGETGRQRMLPGVQRALWIFCSQGSFEAQRKNLSLGITTVLSEGRLVKDYFGELYLSVFSGPVSKAGLGELL